MNVKIHPSRFISENKFLGSKSLTHRFLLACFLANNSSIIDNIAENDDIDATMSFFKAIGVEIIYTSKHSCYLKPLVDYKMKDVIYIDANSSASTLRFLLPLALNFASKVIFNCSDSLIRRSIETYQNLTEQCNLSIKTINNQIICSGKISLDYYEIEANISSQFVTGLIINALYQKKATTIKIKGILESKSYVLMTVNVFKQFGFDIDFDDINNTIYVYKSNNISWDEYFIEGDYSSSSNLIVLACLNGSIIARNIFKDSIQPDYKIVELLKNIGGNIYFVNENNRDYLVALNSNLISKGIAKQLKCFDINVQDCIDLAPILMVLACFSQGTSYIRNVNRLVYKESDRLKAMLDNLKLLNVDVRYENNVVSITGKKQYFNNVELNSHNDHRIAMALSVFALLNNGLITIKDVECVSKSYPSFYDDLINGCKTGSIEIIK